MNILSGDISPLIFQLMIINEPGEFTLDNQMFRVVAELDGKKTVGAIAKTLGMSAENIKQVIAKLLKLKIISLVDGTLPILKEDFFIYLTEQLSLAIGPMAEILIEDSLASLECELSKFPKHRAKELVDLLTHKITREEKRAIFKQNLAKKILNGEGAL